MEPHVWSAREIRGNAVVCGSGKCDMATLRGRATELRVDDACLAPDRGHVYNGMNKALSDM